MRVDLPRTVELVGNAVPPVLAAIVVSCVKNLLSHSCQGGTGTQCLGVHTGTQCLGAHTIIYVPVRSA